MVRTSTTRPPAPAVSGYPAAVSTEVEAPSRAPERADGYAPLRDYAVIGNKRTAALVARDGSIDWLPVPTFDGPSVFAAVLDPRDGGRFSLAPDAPFEASQRYLPDTNVVETRFTTAEGSVRVLDAMALPIARALPWTQVIRRVEGVAGRVPMRWRVEPRFGYGATAGRVERRAGAPVFAHRSASLAVQAFDAGEPEVAGGGAGARFEAREGETALLAVSAFEGSPLTLSTREELDRHLDGTAAAWREWVRGVAYDGPWAEAVRRSALALDLLVDDRTGAIAAAATMGLPERIGGERNFDYRYGWLRDANLTLEAMLNLGLTDQVHASLSWMLRTIAGTHPRLRPMYRLDGTPRLPERELDLPGYRGSRPVTLGNQAQDQLQLGSYGDIFDMTFKHVARDNALGDEAARRLAEVADHLVRIWEHRDSGIWELDTELDYTQSKLACWMALDRAARLAEHGALPAEAAPRWRAAGERIRRYVERRCWSERVGAYARSAGSDELDAAVLLATRGSFIEQQRERFSSTVDAIRRELGAGGALVYRYTGMREEEGAFVACSFWVAEALARAGRVDEAAEAMERLVALPGPSGLLTEEVDPSTGELLGNLPQALSHLSLVNAAVAIRDASS